MYIDYIFIDYIFVIKKNLRNRLTDIGSKRG